LSILSPQTPYGFTTFFDDLRQEVNGKYIFSGVYTGNMVFPFVPIVLPMFSVMTTYREAPGESNEPVTLKIFVPGSHEPMSRCAPSSGANERGSVRSNVLGCGGAGQNIILASPVYLLALHDCRRGIYKNSCVSRR
jgi:hypothetical protein